MALTPGTRLGQYEVIDTLGAGGMGEVYRAIDARLKPRNGRELFYLTEAGALMQVQVDVTTAISLGTPAVLLKGTNYFAGSDVVEVRPAARTTSHRTDAAS